MTLTEEEETHPCCEPPHDLLAHPPADLAHALADGLEGAALAELHEDLDLAARGGDIHAIELDDVLVLRGRDNADLAQELLHRGLVRRDRLAGHDPARATVAHLVDGAAGALAEARELLEGVVGVLVELGDGLAEALEGERGWGIVLGRDGLLWADGGLALGCADGAAAVEVG